MVEPTTDTVAGNPAGDFLEGAEAIAAWLSELGFDFTAQRVYSARRLKTLPIRRDRTVGVYARKSELLAHLSRPQTLTEPES
jgi:hypothetical protein